MLSSYEKNEDPQRAITFGDGNQGLVKGLGKIAIHVIGCCTVVAWFVCKEPDSLCTG
jgi:hypothetical protein